tara:strand:- start:516 stop:1700 length:1185 start_codon:yes stop_codon:yes gene_type:complete
MKRKGSDLFINILRKKRSSRKRKSYKRKSTKRRIRRRKTKRTRKIKRYRGGASIEELLSNVPKFFALKLPQEISDEISQKISIKRKEHGEYSIIELEKMQRELKTYLKKIISLSEDNEHKVEINITFKQINKIAQALLRIISMDLSKSGNKGKTRKPRHRKIKGGMEAAEIKRVCDENDSDRRPNFCSICYEFAMPDNPLLNVHAGCPTAVPHCYHKTCIEKWINEKFNDLKGRNWTDLCRMDAPGCPMCNLQCSSLTVDHPWRLRRERECDDDGKPVEAENMLDLLRRVENRYHWDHPRFPDVGENRPFPTEAEVRNYLEHPEVPRVPEVVLAQRAEVMQNFTAMVAFIVTTPFVAMFNPLPPAVRPEPLYTIIFVFWSLLQIYGVYRIFYWQ